MSHPGDRSAPARPRPAPVRMAVPALGLAAGVAYLLAAWAGGHLRVGLGMAALMVAFSAGVLFASRYSETMRGLLDRRDERINVLDLNATAFAALAVIVAATVSVLVDLAQGRQPRDAWIDGVACVAYLSAIVWQRIRN